MPSATDSKINNLTYIAFIHKNAPGAMYFSKGGGGGATATITDRSQPSSQVAMGNNLKY